jgi:hypothetical protein
MLDRFKVRVYVCVGKSMVVMWFGLWLGRWWWRRLLVCVVE